MTRIFLVGLFCLAACTTPSVLVTQSQQAGDEANNRADYPAAVAEYEKCLEASTKLGVYRNTEMEAQVCRKISHAYQVMGKMREAAKYIGYATTLDSINKNQLEYIGDIREAGKIELMQGSLLKGIEKLKESLFLSEEFKNSLKDMNRNTGAEVQLALAQAFLMLGHLEESEQYAKDALTIFTSTKETRGQAECELVLGSIYADRTSYEPAMLHFRRSVELSQAQGLETARQFRAMSNVALFTGEYEKALKFMLQAKDKADSSRIIPQMIWAEVGLGDVYRYMGDQDKARVYYDRSLQIEQQALEENKSMKASLDVRLGNVFDAETYFSSQQSKAATAISLMRIGDLYLSLARNDSALTIFSMARKLFEEVGMREGITRAGLGLTRTYLALNSLSEAGEAITAAARGNKNPDLVWEILFLQGYACELGGQTDIAIENYLQSIKEVESFRIRLSTDELKSSYMNNKREVYNRLINLLMSKGRPLEALEIAERGKARAFLDLMGNQKVGNSATIHDPLIEKEQLLSSRIVQLKRKFSENAFTENNAEQTRLSQDIISQELINAQNDYEQLLLQIKLSNPQYFSLVSVAPVGIDSIKKVIPASTVLIEFWTDPAQTVVWIIGRETVTSFAIGLGEEEVFQKVGDARHAIETLSPAAKARCRELYDQLFAPLETGLGSSINLGFLPHGPLHLLPFQALVDRKGKSLAERFSIFYYPSANVFFLNHKKQSLPGNDLLAMALGNLQIGNFPGLPGTLKELQMIAASWPGAKLFTDEHATESAFKKQAPNCQFIHLATHGFFNEDQPAFSFLLFMPDASNDGQLTVSEIYSLSLNAKLVTLSACQTGLGKLTSGDELTGLTRAFLYAGSRSVVASLWSVADEPTATLMVDFYSNLKNHPLPEALAMAERTVMKKWPEPFYWAPFQLYGNANLTGH